MYDIANNINVFIKSIRLTANAFAKNIGIDQANMSKMLRGKQKISDKTVDKICAAYPELSRNWLLTGEGEMLRPQQERQVKIPAVGASVEQRNLYSPGATMFATNVNNNYAERRIEPMEVEDAGSKVRPLIPMNLYKKTNTDVYESIVNKKQVGVELIPYFSGFSEYQMYMEVQDESMLPDFKVGDKVAISVLSKDTYILNGNIYAMDTKNHGLFIRILIDRGNEYECQSTNNQSRYVSFRVPKYDVIRLYRVMGLIRTCI